MAMDRIYLYVPPEEYAGVEAYGASWDEDAKCWYVPEHLSPAVFSRWVEDEGSEFGISSDEAFVVSAKGECVQCRREIEVVCIYCESGVDVERDEPLMRFTVSAIWAIDEVLAAALARWPLFRRELREDIDEGCFANHCAHCGAVQEDYRLHSEPGDVFFNVAEAEPGSIALVPLTGRVRLSGDYAFGV
jgi:hypothetical protein